MSRWISLVARFAIGMAFVLTTCYLFDFPLVQVVAFCGLYWCVGEWCFAHKPEV